MAWKPDSELELRISQIVARARDNAAVSSRDEIKRVRETELSRGRSGAAIKATEALIAEELRRSIEPAITDTLTLLTAVYGDVPTEAVSWLRTLFNERIDRLEAGLSQRLNEARAEAKITKGAADRVNTIAFAMKRDLDIRLAPIELRARLRNVASGTLPSSARGPRTIDAFLSYAGEDRADVSQPLADRLIAMGYEIWFDKYVLKVGISVYAAIDEGLRSCRAGVVILSPSFFAKDWPQRELHALAALAAAEGRQKILPVWHELGAADIARYSALLAGVWATRTADGLDVVVNELVKSLGPPRSARV